MATEAELINAEFVANLLTMRATVYTRGVGGEHDVVARADLPCLLMSISANSAASVPDRLELAATRTFQYDATYDLPETGVQIAVDVFPGKRWTPREGTADPAYVPGIGVIAASVLVTQAD